MTISTSEPVPLRELSTRLRNQAKTEGFALCGLTYPQAMLKAGKDLPRFLREGRHGEMYWLAERAHWRADAAALWPEARTVIMLAEPYFEGGDPLTALKATTKANISLYARHRDYHELVKKRLKRLARWLIAEAAAAGQAGVEVKVFVDTAPVMEKPLAAAAGLGWVGKHTNLVSRELGSWFFLGAIFTTLELPPDLPHEDHCGTCTRCIDICPTRAITAPYEIDARRCISYLTIELPGPVPPALRPAIGNRIYGCDDCLAICPWNKFAGLAHEITGERGYIARDALAQPDLLRLAALDEAGFRQIFSKSPVRRIGRTRFLRNVAIALGNAAPEPGEWGARATARLRAMLRDEAPLIRGAAIWALSRWLSPEEFRHCRARFEPGEPDADIRAEWAQNTTGHAG